MKKFITFYILSSIVIGLIASLIYYIMDYFYMNINNPILNIKFGLFMGAIYALPYRIMLYNRLKK